ncbi:hypothetical protein H257_13704 [Aphanomyces astaci]|uniref:Uncharacterized protein n=1 Tax=Aphanomyces astaci TaxID=112090 RepID=W4FVJ3_APHAT|nr:hypothetical protein H257_13704 [Aphanomyces astaci]ETV70971.1 hypothetical protein H257_13704 [Aphanomyces astaci]KAF0706420.1 hypothetical protein AaE_014119 [Aphanomyces astaci]|eukprot:XP_009839634.1 hypothetical protein H257_13704 [Aphanomyces astaci]
MFTSMLRMPRSPSQWLPHLTKKSDSVPDCCRRQSKAALAASSNNHHQRYSSYDGISYQFVDGSLLHRLSTTVGGHRVVFGLAQVKLLRRKLDLNVALSPIEEEATSTCESCHSNTFSRLSKTKCITLLTLPLK